MRLPPAGAESPRLASLVKLYPAAPASRRQNTMPARPIAVQSPSLVIEAVRDSSYEPLFPVFIGSVSFHLLHFRRVTPGLVYSCFSAFLKKGAHHRGGF